MPEETPPPATSLTPTTKAKDTVPIKTEPDLSSRFSECCQPGIVDPDSLPHDSFILLRGGDKLTIGSRGNNKHTQSSQYFLMRARNSEQQVSSTKTFFSVHEGFILEVFPKDGQNLVFHTNDIVDRDNSSTAYLRYDTKDDTLAESIAAIKPEYEKEWEYLFDRIFDSELPLTPTQHSTKLSYEAAMGNINSLADGMALSAKNLKLDDLKRAPMKLHDVILNSTYSTEFNLLDLESLKERRGISKVLAEHLTGDVEPRPYFALESVGANERMGEVFGLSSSFKQPASTKEPTPSARVVKLPNGRYKLASEATEKELKPRELSMSERALELLSSQLSITADKIEEFNLVPKEERGNIPNFTENRREALTRYDVLSTKHEKINKRVSKSYFSPQGGASDEQIDVAASTIISKTEPYLTRPTVQEPKANVTTFSHIGLVSAGRYRSDFPRDFLYDMNMARVVKYTSEIPGARNIYVAEFIPDATTEMIDKRIQEIKDSFRAKHEAFFNKEVWDTLPTKDKQGKEYTGKRLTALKKQRDEIVDQLFDSEGMNDALIADYGGSSLRRQIIATPDHGGGVFIVMPERIYGFPGGRTLEKSEFEAQLSAYGDSSGLRHILSSEEIEYRIDESSTEALRQSMIGVHDNLLQKYADSDENHDADVYDISEHEARLAQINEADVHYKLQRVRTLLEAGLDPEDPIPGYKKGYLERAGLSHLHEDTPENSVRRKARMRKAGMSESEVSRAYADIMEKRANELLQEAEKEESAKNRTERGTAREARASNLSSKSGKAPQGVEEVNDLGRKALARAQNSGEVLLVGGHVVSPGVIVPLGTNLNPNGGYVADGYRKVDHPAGVPRRGEEMYGTRLSSFQDTLSDIKPTNEFLIRYKGQEMTPTDYFIATADLPSKDFNPVTDTLYMDARLVPGVHSAGHTAVNYRFLTEVLGGTQTPDKAVGARDSVKKIQTILADMESQLSDIAEFKKIISDLNYEDFDIDIQDAVRSGAKRSASDFETTMLHLRARHGRLGNTAEVAKLDRLSQTVTSISREYVGGHQINPIELLQSRNTMKGTIGEQIKYKLETLFPDEVFDKDNPAPTVDDFLHWVRDSPNTVSRIVNPRRQRRNSGTRNAWEFTRSLVDRYTQARGWQYHEFDPNSDLTNVPKPTMPTPDLESLTLTGDDGKEYDRPLKADSDDPVREATENLISRESTPKVKAAIKPVRTGHSVYSILAGLEDTPEDAQATILGNQAKHVLSQYGGVSRRDKIKRLSSLFGYQFKRTAKGVPIPNSFIPISPSNFQQFLDGKRKGYSISDNQLTTHFEMVQSMSQHQIETLSDEIGLTLKLVGGPTVPLGDKKRNLRPGTKDIFAPISGVAPVGYHDFVTELEKSGAVPKGRLEDQPLSSAQYQLLKHLQEHTPVFNLEQNLSPDVNNSRKLLTKVFNDPRVLGTLPPLAPQPPSLDSSPTKESEAEVEERSSRGRTSIHTFAADPKAMTRLAQRVEEAGGQPIVRNIFGTSSISLDSEASTARRNNGPAFSFIGDTLLPIPAHSIVEAANSRALNAEPEARAIIRDSMRENIAAQRVANQDVEDTRHAIDTGEYLFDDPRLIRASNRDSESWENSKQRHEEELKEFTRNQETLRQEYTLLRTRKALLNGTPNQDIPLYEARMGNKRVILPPEDNLSSTAGKADTLAEFIEKTHQPGGATLIGFDIETGVQKQRDASGKVILRKSKSGVMRALKEKTDLRNIGLKTATITSDGKYTTKSDDGIDYATQKFYDKRKNKPGGQSLTVIGGDNEQDGLILKTEEYFREAFRLNPEAFVTTFNTRFDLPNMIEYAKASKDARVNASAAYFRDVVMPRTIEASHFAVLSGAQRKDSKMETFMQKVFGDDEIQSHTALSDVIQMFAVIESNIKKFVTGQSGHFHVQPAEKIYVFPKHVTPEDGVMGGQGQLDRLNQSKAPFQVTRVVKKDVTYQDGTVVSAFQTYGKRIDEHGNTYGPEEARLGWTPGAGELQRKLTQDGYYSTNEAGLKYAWRDHLNDDVLGDLAGRNVRRVTDEPLGYHQSQVREDVNRGVYSKRENYIARGRIARGYDSMATDLGKEPFLEHIKKNLSGGVVDDVVKESYHPLNPLLRPDGTIDTSEAQSIYSWITASPGTTQDNPGFSDPHERYIIGRTGQVLEERAETVDKHFLETIHASYKAGELSPEEYTRATRAYNAHMHSGYTAPPLADQPERAPKASSVFLNSHSGGATKLTELKTDMSKDQIFEKLFEHAAATQDAPAKIMTALNAEGADTAAIIAKEAQGMSMSMARGLRNLVAGSATELNHIGDKEEYSLHSLAKEIHTSFNDGSFNSRNQTPVQDSLSSKMPFVGKTQEEVTHEGISQYMDFAADMPWTPRPIPEDPKLASIEKENLENLSSEDGSVRAKAEIRAKAISRIREKADQELDSQTAFHHRKYAESLAQRAGMGSLSSPTFSAAEQNTNEATAPYLEKDQKESLMSALQSVESEPIESSTRFTPPITSSTLAQRAMDKEPELIQNAAPVLRERAQAESAEEISNALTGMSSRSKLGYALGATALLAAAAYMGNSIIENQDKQKGIVSPTVPSSTHDHDAGAQDEELATEGSDSQTAGIQGWRKLHIEVDVSHPGFSGSTDRMDPQALQAFSTDVSSVLTKHFGGQYDPDGSSVDSSSQQDGTLKSRVSDILLKAHGRHGG